MYTIHPLNSECYHLRLLLHTIRGPTSFESLKTVEGITHPTFQAACKALGLLEDDGHWNETLKDAALCLNPERMRRQLFATILVFCNISNTPELWSRYKDAFS